MVLPIEALKAINEALFRGGDFGASVRVSLSKRNKEPDYFYVPFGLKCPTLVLEVAYGHESLKVLEEELADWLGPNRTIQIAIGILIHQEKKGVTMKAIIKRRNGVEKRLNFGTNKRNPARFLEIPLQDIVRGTEAANKKYPVSIIRIDLGRNQRKGDMEYKTFKIATIC